MSCCQAQDTGVLGFRIDSSQSFSGTGLLLGPVPHWASGADYIAARAAHFQGSGGHLFLTVEGTAGMAQGAKVSLRMKLSEGLEGPRRFFPVPGEKARAVVR